MTNFSPGWQRLPPSCFNKTNHCACPSALFYPGNISFQPRLKLYSDYTRFFSPFAWAEISSPVSKPVFLCNHKHGFKKICSRNWAENLACLTGLKFYHAISPLEHSLESWEKWSQYCQGLTEFHKYSQLWCKNCHLRYQFPKSNIY